MTRRLARAATASERLAFLVDVCGVDRVAHMIVESLLAKGMTISEIQQWVDRVGKRPLGTSPKDSEGAPVQGRTGVPPEEHTHGSQEEPMTTPIVEGEIVNAAGPAAQTRAMVAQQRSVTAITDLPLINVAAEKKRLDNFREFVSTCLEEGKHFGIPKDDKGKPTVKKGFLWQDGAEILYRGLECRAEYDVTYRHIDPKSELVVYEVKCRVIHIASGMLMGEKSGAASSMERAKNCYAAQPRKRKDAQDTYFDCPKHGENPGAFFTAEDGGKMIRCDQKVPESFATALHNTLAKAEKRAYVGAIRNVGCVSEIFTSDDDLVPADRGGTAPAERPQRAPAAKNSSKAAPKDAPKSKWPAWRNKQGWFNAPEFAEQIKACYAALKKAWEGDTEAAAAHLRIFLVDDDIDAGEKLGKFQIGEWCEKHDADPDALAKAVIERFSPGKEEEEAPGGSQEEGPAAGGAASDGTDPDDLPFE